jgi:hypothetical protein
MSSIDQIFNWFQKAIPVVSEDNKRVQVGVHIEEFTEMLCTFKFKDNPNQHEMRIPSACAVNEALADFLKNNKDVDLITIDRKELLDSLCDQIVTAIGVAHMFGFDIRSALKEVADSNDSKFVDGKPIFNAAGKIAKGPNYFKPDIARFADLTN